MKTSRILTFSLCAFLIGTASVLGQQTTSEPATVKKSATLKIDKNKIKVQRHTVMERFEPDFAATADIRMEKKQKRLADTKRKLHILDTLDISDRRRRKLLLDLKYSPYSNRLNKAILVDTDFEEDASENK